MDPESQKLLKETFELAKENNQMLRKIRSVQKWAAFWSLFKIFVIVGIALGTFYFLQPYLDGAMNTYNSVFGREEQSSSNSLQNFFKR